MQEQMSNVSRDMKMLREMAQSCPTLSDPMDCSLPGSSTHGIFQARVLEWGAIAFSTKRNTSDQKHCKGNEECFYGQIKERMNFFNY